MSAISIGLIGHNGLVGSKILKNLIQLQQQGKVSLVVIHRPSSSLTTVPDDVEKRVLDWSKSDGKEYDDAVVGLHVVISAVSSEGAKDQLAILPALSRSPTLQTFFPSDFGAPWTKDELGSIRVPFIEAKEELVDQAKKLGVALSEVKIGLLTDFIFPFPIHWNARENQVFVYAQSQETKVPFTSSDYIGVAVASLLQRPLESLKNKLFYAVEEYHTGKEISNLIAKIHGEEITVIPISEEQVQKGVVSANAYEALGTAILRKSGQNAWKYDGIEEIKVGSQQGKGVEYELRKVISP